MKQIIIAFLIATLFLVAAVKALDNNFYFTIPENSTGCLPVFLPDDSGHYKEGNFTISIDTTAAINIHKINTEASPENQVTVPLCFSTSSMKNNDFANYTLNIISPATDMKFSGGFCVAGRKDVDIGEGKNPCDIINGNSELYSIDFYTRDVFAKSGDNVTVQLFALSNRDLALEITADSGLIVKPNATSINLKAHRTEVVEFVISGNKLGSLKLNSTAIIDRKFCVLPFCKKTAELNVVYDTGESGWYLSATPSYFSVNSVVSVPYKISLENYGDDKHVSIGIMPETGLASSIRTISADVKKGERKTIDINITPETLDKKTYRIDFTASADGIEKKRAAYLSVGELSGDIGAQFEGVDSTDPQIQLLKDRLLQAAVSGDVDDYTRLQNLLAASNKSPASQKNQTTLQPSKTSPLPIEYLVIPVAIIIILVVIYSLRKMSFVEEENDE